MMTVTLQQLLADPKLQGHIPCTVVLTQKREEDEIPMFYTKVTEALDKLRLAGFNARLITAAHYVAIELH